MSIPHKQTLNFFQRKIAADWVNRLFDLAPKGTGVSNIYFYNTFIEPSLAGKKREHPLSDLLIENFVANVKDTNQINVKVPLDKSRKVLALWISSDGDDTKSSYEVTLNEIILK